MARRLHLADETPLDRSLAKLRTARGAHGIERVRRGQWSPVGNNVWSPNRSLDVRNRRPLECYPELKTWDDGSWMQKRFLLWLG
jgi:hypothetical protein